MKADTVIVGGGIAGCLIANALAKAGRSIILIESGKDQAVDDWREGTWFDIPYDRFEADSDLPYSVDYSRVKAMGGSTEAWEGYCYRLLDDEFKMHSHYGVGYDWPIGLDELEPYYHKAEQELGVAGDHAEFGRPKSDQPPLAPFSFESYEKYIIRCAQKIGMNFLHVPQARNSAGYSRRPACRNLGMCNFCPIGARYSPSVTLIPRLRKNNKVLILTQTLCKELIQGKGKRISGIIAHSKETGKCYPIWAETIVLSAGTIDTLRILLLSKSMWGKKDKRIYDQLGRNFMDHPILRLQVKTAWRTNARKRQTNILAASHDYRKYNPKAKSAGFLLNLNSRVPPPNALLAAHMEMMPSPDNRISLSRKTDPAGLPIPKLTFYSTRGLQASTVARARKVLYKLASLIGNGEINELPLQLWACHLMGGARMGESPENSVLNKNLRLHTHDNVFIASLACMPTSSSVNPTLTLTALTLRLGDHLLGIS